jgi:EAL domain-containing protein (putative c-di-GMP-specific phosphodiesterase class I)/GGDEF domain-containing protein
MERQGDGAGETGTVRIAPASARDLVRAAEAAGWRTDAADPLVIVADARAGPAHLAAQDAAALDTRAALLAVIDAGQAADAYAAGATHVAVGIDALADALRFAGRHARRLRGEGRTRRLTDLADARVPGRFIERHADTGVSVIVAALTSFEIVNTAFGRAAGDLLVRAAQARIARALAGIEVTMLRNGSAFTIAAAGPPPLVGEAVAAIERTLAEPFAVGEETIHVGARIGVAHGGAGEPAKQLLRRAAEALARARGSDGATTQIAASEATPLVELAADLHRAIDRQEIDVLFQPQVALADGRIAGVEALARWRHPRLGALGAETLFAAAERADIGAALSDHVQSLALARAAAWPAALAHLRVAVNVTAADIARSDFVAQFLDRVDASGVARARVTAEIVEGGLIEDLDCATRLLTGLRDAGCRVAVDDFGTGYSSFAYLTTLPLDYLKIDRRLTQDLAGDRRQQAVVEGVIAIAGALGLETVAEGVETEEQRALLAARGCTYFQGFLCSEPVDAAGLVRVIAGG